MCTLSWCYTGSTLQVLFNRDERYDRPIAEPPSEWARNNARVISPRDPSGGGSWISANDSGLVLCLLNHYGADIVSGRSKGRSRGLLVMDLAPSETIESLSARLSRTMLAVYEPFMLAAFQDQHVVLWTWNGVDLERDDRPICPVSTSSLMPVLVPAMRRAYFRLSRSLNGQSDPAGTDLALHGAGRPWPGPFSIAMERRDRGTVSLTRVQVGADSVAMDYWPGNPRYASTDTSHSATMNRVCRVPTPSA